MDISTLPPDQVATLLERILADKDPASVGLRRIVRKRTTEAYDFPMRGFTVEDFSGNAEGSKMLSDDERRIIELEQKVVALQKTIKDQSDKARTAIQNAHTTGFEKGVQKGIAEGRAQSDNEFRQKLEGLQESMHTVVRNLETEKNEIYARADRTMLELCRLMVRKIIAAETTQNAELVLHVLRKALTYVAEREKLVIRVSSRDVQTVTDNREFWAPVAERLRDVTIEPDDRIQPGGCVIESNSGVVDGRIDTQVAELGDLIEKAWEAMHEKKNTPEADV
jgi:flagellar assembly protein FliH